jgi:hypothetical protein
MLILFLFIALVAVPTVFRRSSFCFPMPGRFGIPRPSQERQSIASSVGCVNSVEPVFFICSEPTFPTHGLCRFAIMEESLLPRWLRTLEPA